jgi:hypothetical protein
MHRNRTVQTGDRQAPTGLTREPVLPQTKRVSPDPPSLAVNRGTPWRVTWPCEPPLLWLRSLP